MPAAEDEARENAAEEDGASELGPLEDVAVLEERCEELRAQNLRLLADFENLRRRQRRDEEELRLRLRQEVVELVLGPLDDLERALAAASPDDPLAAGVAMVRQGLLGVLQRFGAEPIAAVGQTFDPGLHEALGEEESDLEPGTVAVELRTGYRIQDRVVRPALVRVAKSRE